MDHGAVGYKRRRRKRAGSRDHEQHGDGRGQIAPHLSVSLKSGVFSTGISIFEPECHLCRLERLRAADGHLVPGYASSPHSILKFLRDSWKGQKPGLQRNRTASARASLSYDSTNAAFAVALVENGSRPLKVDTTSMLRSFSRKKLTSFRPVHSCSGYRRCRVQSSSRTLASHPGWPS